MENYSRVSVPERVVPTPSSSIKVELDELAPTTAANSKSIVASEPTAVTATFLDVLHDPAIVVEPYSKVILAANKRAFETYSCDGGELVGQNAAVIWTDTIRESRSLAETLSKSAVSGFDTIHRNASGTEIVISTNSSLVMFEGKRAVLSINLDVTEREKTQQGIVLANVEWRDTVDSVQDMIILEDQYGRIRRCNAATIRFFGKTYKDTIGKSLSSMLEPAPKSPPDHLRRPFWEGRFIGSEEWFEIKSDRAKADNGTGNVWVHVIKDITAQRNSKQELLKLYSVIEQASDGTIIVDVLGTIEYVNEIAEKALCKVRSELVGQSISAAKPDITAEMLRDEIFPYLESESFWRTTNRVIRDRETIIEEITVSRITSSDDVTTNYVLVFRDVTETRQLESIAEAVNLMENVGYVFSGIRHELGNPINSVKMALTVLEKNFEKWDHEQVHVFITRCLQELGRVEYLLRQLKSFSLHEGAEIEPVDIEEFMVQFASITRSDFERRGIEVQFEGTLKHKALCDPRALHQAMINLLANAADALAEREDPRVTIKMSENRRRVMISVEDNGIGMTEKQQSNLFKPFYTSKPCGTGLGLVIVQKMLAMMGGTIEIESQVDIGTQARIGLKPGGKK